MEFKVCFKEGLPKHFGYSYLFWLWDGTVVEGKYWKQDGHAVVTHYNMVDPSRPQPITQSANKVHAWAECKQARPEALNTGASANVQKYVLKTSDGYLYPRDGDVGWTPDLNVAGRFTSKGEAEDTAAVNGYNFGEFQVISVA